MFTRTIWVGALVLGVVATAQAQPSSLQKHEYEITPQAGPWAINVACFFENFDQPERQEDLPALLAKSRARRLAISFVTILRRDYKLPAYLYNRGDEERSKEQE